MIAAHQMHSYKVTSFTSMTVNGMDKYNKENVEPPSELPAKDNDAPLDGDDGDWVESEGIDQVWPRSDPIDYDWPTDDPPKG